MANSPKKSPLNSLNILITRPKHQNQTLNEKIKSLGGNPINLPCMKIEPLNITAQIENLPQQIDVIIFMSANAVTHSLKLLQILSTKTQPTLIAIGPGTKAALQRANLNPIIMPNTYDSEGVLALSILQTLQNKTIYLCCGKDSRPLLKNTLQKRGALVIPITCYQRSALTLTKKDIHLLQNNRIDCTVTTSFSGLRFWQQMLKQTNLNHLLSTPTLIIAKKYKKPAQELGFTHLLISNQADDNSITNTLVQNLNDTSPAI